MAGSVGLVAIGRNEGDRLRRCLASALRSGCPVVYVDSASSDGSPQLARESGVAIVELDPGRPLSAARGRNAGWAHLVQAQRDLRFVQFIDGDCELDEAWLDSAVAHLDAHPEVGAVAGRRRERHPEASRYNRLIDMEWDTPLGRVDTFGGDVMVRVSILQALRGYDETLVAGEDPDLARRVRAAGHEIHRLDAEMTRHDAAIERLQQWWTRGVRSGHAAAEAWHRSDARFTLAAGRRLGSIIVWGALLPVGSVACLVSSPILGLSLPLLYPAMALRIFWSQQRRGRSRADAGLYALSCVAGKFAEASGAARLFWTRVVKGSRTSTLIEYK